MCQTTVFEEGKFKKFKQFTIELSRTPKHAIEAL